MPCVWPILACAHHHMQCLPHQTGMGLSSSRAPVSQRGPVPAFPVVTHPLACTAYQLAFSLSSSAPSISQSPLANCLPRPLSPH